MKFKSLNEWRYTYPGAYDAALKNGMLESICKKNRWEFSLQRKKCKPANYWTFENCLKDALKYKLKKDWLKNSASAYMVALKNGWLNECYSHMIIPIGSKGYWTKEKCLEDALKYKSKKEWEKNSGGYNASKRKGWFNECCSHMIIKFGSRGYWTKEKCREIALKYTKRITWRKEHPSSYEFAQRNKYLDEMSCHMKIIKKPKGYWTFDKCLEDALKYKQRTTWRIKHNTAYKYARENGWLDKCCAHMIEIIKPNYFWTLKKCIIDSKKCTTKVEWSKKFSKSYSAARRNKKWFQECTKHMENGNKKTKI